jgi:hypothetical protein
MSYRIKTSDITASAGLPLKKGSIDLINNEFQLLGSYTGQMFGKVGSGASNNSAIASGLVPTITGSSYAFTAGVVFYYGEFFSVPAATINVTGGNVPILTVVTNYVMGADSDPVTFTDGSSHNVHQLRTMTMSAGASNSGTVNWSDVPYWSTVWFPFSHPWVLNASWRINQGELYFKGQAQIGSGNANTVLTLPSWVIVRQTAARFMPMYDVGTGTADYASLLARVDAVSNVLAFGDGPTDTGTNGTQKYDLSAASGIQLF